MRTSDSFRPPRRAPLIAALTGMLALAITAPVLAETPKAPADKTQPAAKQSLFNAEVATLDNGMKIVVIPHRRAPVVRHMVWYKAGAADEPVGKSGIAHFLEHLMWKATKTRPSGQFSAVVARFGGQENAFTTQDYTAYHQTISKDRLEEMMALEADRMVNLALVEKDIKAERDVILEERRSRTDTRPSALLWERARAILYHNYPYRIPVIGWRHEMEKLSLEDANAFYRRFYAPNNAILIVAGDVSMADVLPLARKYYGAIPRRPLPPRVRPVEPPPLTARRITLTDHRVNRASWGRLYLAPSYSYGETKHAHALEVLSQIIGSSTTSRLYQSLTVKQKLATNAGAWYSGTSLGPTSFGFYASPRDGVPVARLEAAMDAEIAAIVRDGVTPAELARAKRILIAESIYERDSISTGASIIGAALSTGLTLDDVEKWPERISAVTLADIKAAAAYVLQARRSVTGILLPATKKADAARKETIQPAKGEAK